MARIRICKEEGCKDAATTGGYCRLHYLKNWKRIKNAAKKRAAKKLNRYVESMMKRHPKRYVEAIKEDLKKDRFRSYEDSGFGDDEEDEADALFGEPNYDEEVRELIEKLKNKTE
jgi:hypothetical protein